jgi:tetratricopeptide (TPR) repeat protein
LNYKEKKEKNVDKKQIIIMVFFIVASLFGQHGSSDFEEYMNYQKEPTIGHLIKAVKHYNAQLEGDSKYTAHLMLAHIFHNEFQKNMDILDGDLDSLSTRTQFSYANLLLDIGQFEKSITIYDILNKNFPKWSCPWRHKGEALLKMEKYEKAEVATIKAIEVREDHFDAYVQLAVIQKDLGKYEEALRSLEKGLSYHDSDPKEEVSDKEVEELYDELLKLIEKTSNN